MAKDDLLMRLYREQPLYELARYISYGGKRDRDVKEKCDELRSRHGDHKILMALVDLTTKDEGAGLTVLKPHVRPLCFQLLGPAPEHKEYARFWEGRTPPAEHQPPGPEEEEAKPKRKGRGR